MKWINLSGCTLLLMLSCSGLKSNINNISKVWINQKYIDCIQNSLPCQCINSNEVSGMLFLDTLTIIEIYSNKHEPSTYNLVKISENSFYYLSENIDEEGFLVMNDTVYISISENRDYIYMGGEKFITDNSWKNYKNDFLSIINANLFNEKYKKYFNNYINDSTFFYCDSYRNENIYLLLNDCSKQYLIDYSNDSVNIYKVLNGCEDLSLNYRFEKELFISFKLPPPLPHD